MVSPGIRRLPWTLGARARRFGNMSHIELVLWLGLAIGLAFGACGQATGFCLYRGLVQRWSGSAGYKLHAFAMALVVALTGTQVLSAFGLVNLDASLYLTPSYSWFLLPAGGLLFGYGMGLANGCGARALVLLGTGNLRSLVVLICLGIAAYMTLTGVLGPLRIALADLTTVSPSMLSVPGGLATAATTLVLTAALLLYALRRTASLRGLSPKTRRSDLAGGFVVGLLVVGGWFATGTLGQDDFDPLPVVSLTFVAPIGDTIQYAMLATGMNLRFGIAVVAGVILGALVTALFSRDYRLQGFDSSRQMLRYIFGGSLMGIGGALALGCSIGQGLTGLSTLSFSSMLSAVSIVLGARLAWMHDKARSDAAQLQNYGAAM